MGPRYIYLGDKMAIAFVANLIGQGQTISGTPTSFTTNTLTNGASVGDLVVVNVYTGNNVDAGGMTISDSSGNTWTKELSNSSDSLRALQAYCILTTALTTSSTITIGGLNSNSGKRIVLIAAAFSGVSAVDISGTFGSSSTSDSLTTASDLMVTFSGTQGSTSTTITPASGFTEVDDISVENTSNITLEMAYRINAFTAGSYTYTPTYNSDAGSTKRRTRILTFTETAGTNISVNAACPNVAIAGTTIPSVQIIASTVGTPYKLHADADTTADYARIAGEGWTYTSNGGTPHYQDVDESVVDFTDYITMSGTQSSGNYWYYSLGIQPYVGHGGITDPGTGKGHILRYAYEIVTSTTQGQNAGIWLYAGNTYIGQFSNTQFGLSLDNQGDPIIFQMELSEAEANLIDDYSDLFFVPFMIGSATETVDMRWHWFELEIPEVQVTGGLAFKTNVGVTGFAPTISTTSNISVSQDTANVNVVGHNSTINIVNPTLVNPVITNISLNGQDATISVTSNVQVENTFNTINILGHNVDLILGNNFIGAPETALITLNAHDATVSVSNPTIVNVTSSNIAIDAKNTSSSYYNTVVEHTPVHWWRLTEETSPTSIADDGSSPVSGTSNSIEADYVVGIPGAWSDGKEALTLGGSTIPKVIKFNSNPIANNSNMTLEFWIKPQQILQNASAFINYFNNASTGISGTNNVRTTIGLYQGKVCVANIYYTSGGSAIADITTVSDNITINQWSHVVLTKSTSGSTSTYKSYINGQETATPLSIGTFFYYGSNNITYQSIGTAVDSSNAFIVNPGLPGNTVTFDEFAVYNTVLSSTMVQEHYSNGRLGPLNAIISADHTDIFLAGISSGTSPSVNAPISNIGITGRNPDINITGAPTIITNVSNIGIDAQDTTITNSGSRIISVQKSNINIKINLPKLKTRDAEFIFINKNDVSLSANDATEINGIDFGGLLYNQIKKDLFKIGNISDFICSFNITVYSKETQVISAVKLSTDNINYSDTIYIENIGPNQMSDNIYVKFDVNALDVLGPGTFLINVEQIYVL